MGKLEQNYGKIWGYARVSTPKQRVDRQIENIKAAYPDAVIYEEKYTGTTTDRPEWNRLRKKLRAGDTVVFDEVSRMSRNAEEGFQLYETMFTEGVKLVFLKEHHLDTEVYRETLQTGVSMTGTDVDVILKGVNEYMMTLAKRQIELAFRNSQAEIDRLHQRTSEGMRRAQASGKRIGRAPGSRVETKKSTRVKKLILKHSKAFGGTLDDKDVITLAGVCRYTYYKYKKELLRAQQPQATGMPGQLSFVGTEMKIQEEK